MKPTFANAWPAAVMGRDVSMRDVHDVHGVSEAMSARAQSTRGAAGCWMVHSHGRVILCGLGR